MRRNCKSLDNKLRLFMGSDIVEYPELRKNHAESKHTPIWRVRKDVFRSHIRMFILLPVLSEVFIVVHHTELNWSCIE